MTVIGGVFLLAKYEEWLTEEGLVLIGGWARDGLTEQQIAENMGIAYSTLREWKKSYPAISAALKKNKEVADRNVENALYNKAVGFTATDRVVSTRKTVEYENGKRVREISEPCVVEVEKYFPPDTTAEIFWLKNRKPDKWRDKQNVELDGESKVMIVDSIPDNS